MERSPADRHDKIIMWAFAKLDVLAFIAASAAITAIVLFALTVFLVAKGAPPGMPIGPHLGELARFFPGYTVSTLGAFIGAGYAAIVGGAIGFALAGAWNLAHAVLLAVVRMRASLASYSID